MPERLEGTDYIPKNIQITQENSRYDDVKVDALVSKDLEHMVVYVRIPAKKICCFADDVSKS